MDRKLTANEREFIDNLHALPETVQTNFTAWLGYAADELEDTGEIGADTWNELDMVLGR